MRGRSNKDEVNVFRSKIKSVAFFLGGGDIEQLKALSLPNPAAPGSNPGVPDNLLSILPRFIDGAAA